MSFFVINEWIWHNLSENHDTLEFREAVTVVYGISELKHSMVILRGSRFEYKLNHFVDRSGSTRVTRELSAVIRDAIYINAGKCIWIENEDVPPFPDNLAGIKEEDQYLVRAQLCVPSSIIVSTDEPLMKILRQAELPFQTRNDFVRQIQKEMDELNRL